MSFPQRIEQSYRARFDECGADGLMRSSSYLRYAQEMAWVHSDLLGLDRAWYEERQLTWVVRSLQLDVVSPIVHGQTFTVSTEVVGWRRALSRRRTELCGPDGSLAALVLIDWVGLGPSGTPVRIPTEIVAMLNESGAATFEPIRASLPTAPADAALHQVTVLPRDIDPMAHVNNAVYLDYMEEALSAAGAEAAMSRVPRRYRLEYVTAAELGDRPTATVWREGTGWAYRLSGEGTRDILRARLEIDPSGLEAGRARR
ncbi:MAG: hypothetical protein H0T04_04505 [Chloroflexi bacterium]|jgi:acyl-CoA thioester hydrolase|nr:hypothetical protein [Chloroflexota bacterium]MBA3851773.1 hypothetical protein [Chloroflexota bacterium]MDQ3406743.1 thioesterase [Chloroflexota bacterium]